MNTKQITFAALFAALIFIFTFTFKIPVGGTVGYAHFGDMFIIMAAWILGRKTAPLAAGLGAALADFASGFAVWIVPTFIIKFLMACIICMIAEKIFRERHAGYIVGTVAAAIFHIAGYLAAWFVIGGRAGVIAAFIPLVMQTVIGLALGNVMIAFLNASPTGRKLKTTVRGDLGYEL